ncbi:MAG: fumarate reductase cytochrome b subunit [bacterium]|nr:fumarate reductase cytochrome b subunit [bacterium]
MSYLTIEKRQRKSRLPARLDLAQSLTGLLLGLFIMGHILFVSAILLGPSTAFWVDKMLEGAFLDPSGHGFPFLVSLSAFGVFCIFVTHALLAMRKFPASWREYRVMQDQVEFLVHEDTKLWLYQAITGFILFFFGSAHVLSMMFNPAQIDPFLAAQRYFGQQMWIFYVILLWAVVVHAGIGLYRVLIKWGWLGGDPRKMRKRIRVVQRILTASYLVVGMLSIAVYMQMGYQRQHEPTVRFGDTLYPQAPAAQPHQQMH